MEGNIFQEQTRPFRRNTHYSSGLFSLISPCLLQNGFPKLALVFAPVIQGNSVVTFLFANTNHYAILILPAWSSLF
jgi:hypothetical protein